MFDELLLWLGYPLRLMATKLAALVLKVCGVAVAADRTMITLGDGQTALAVTDACSGIDQLLVLIVLSLVFAYWMQRGFLRRFMHWCCFLPCIVVSNAVRLVVTVALVRKIGDDFLADPVWHGTLGWAQTLLTVILLILAGALINVASKKDPPPPGNP